MTTPRTLPGRYPPCGRCGAPIAWARTAASPTGTGGKPMPLDPVEDPAGNVAVRNVGDRRRPSLVARVLAGDDTLDETVELRIVPHFATCAPPPAEPPPDNVLPFDVARRRRAGTVKP